MTGPEHYREAERLLAGAADLRSVPPVNGMTRADCVAVAQVHAMLALAASYAFNLVPASDADRQGWADAMSTPDAGGDA